MVERNKEIKKRQEIKKEKRRINLKMKSLKNSRRFALGCVFGVILLLFGQTQIVSSHGKDKVSIDEKYRDKIESEYLKELKDTLVEFECEQSGITMTKVMEMDQRNYTVLIHNKKINYMNFSKKKELSDALEKVAFIDSDSVFKIEFYSE